MSFFRRIQATRVSLMNMQLVIKLIIMKTLLLELCKKTQFISRWNLTNKYGEIVDAAHTLGHTDLTNPMVGEQQSYDETNLDIYTDDDIDPLENRIQLFHENEKNKKKMLI